ncbi:MAG TPA: glycosyltransferase family 2 protein [Terriglobales bacterium]|nr:glycosyltransferase family 2 protein [Terriglobales bacterium]
MNDAVVVIPAFDEAGTVGGIVAAARAHAPVLVVDDGSTDGTAAAARAAGAEVVTHAERRGKGAALATAFAAVRGARRIVTLDADGQHDPADVPRLLAASAESPRAIVIGARVDGGALPRDRALAIHVAGFWLGWVTGAHVTDTQSGFRVYPAALLDEVPLRGGRFVFETAVLVDALRRGWTVREVPIGVVPFAARASRFHPLTDGLAIARYLAGGAVARWRTETGEGMRAVLRVFSHDRRTARHTRMLERAAPQLGTASWPTAIGVAALDEVRTRLTSWWREPRARRARRAALATIATPAALLVVALTACAPAAVPERLGHAVRRLYDPAALPPLEEAPDHPRAPARGAWVTAAPR